MKRFLLFVVFALLSVVFIGFMLNSSVHTNALVNADSSLAQRAQLAADSIDRTLQQRMIQVFTFAALPSLRAFAASDDAERPARMALARAELQSIVDTDPNVRAVGIVDTLGTVILSTDKTMLENWSDRVFVREALRGQIYASVPARDFGEVSQY